MSKSLLFHISIVARLALNIPFINRIIVSLRYSTCKAFLFFRHLYSYTILLRKGIDSIQH